MRMGRSLPRVPGTISMAQSSGGLLNGSNFRCSFPSAAGEISLNALTSAVLGAGFADDVEFVERLFAVDPHIEDTAGFSAAGHIVLAVQRFREVQAKFVDARRERNIVGEGAFAPALVDVRLAGAEDRMIVGFEHRPALKIPVALPNPAQAVRVVAVLAPRQDSDLRRIGDRRSHRSGLGGARWLAVLSGGRQRATATATIARSNMPSDSPVSHSMLRHARPGGTG